MNLCKRIFGVALSFCLLASVGFAHPVEAVDTQNIVQKSSEVSIQINEYETYRQMLEMTDEELLAGGLTQDDIIYLREFDYAEALRKRAALDDSTLNNLGYSTEMIADLRTVAAKGTISENDILSTASVMSLSGDFLSMNRYSSSSSRYVFAYAFEWDSCPIFILSDILAVTWSGTGFDGTPVNVAIDLNESDLEITYAYTGGYPEMDNKTYTWDPDHEYSGASIEFDMGTNVGDGMSCWSKSGAGRLEFDAVVSGTIYELYIKLGYGHAVVAGSPSVSFSGSALTVDFNFSINVDEVDKISTRIRYDGTVMS